MTTRARTVAALLLSLAGALSAIAMPARAQTPNPSFSIVGHIQELRLDNVNDPLSSGQVRVKGILVTLPKNLLVTMPGQFLTLHDIFRGPKPGSGTALNPVRPSSGLALRDSPPPAVPFEIHLIGNIDQGKYIAGHAKIVQMDLGEGAGFVRRIDYAKGELRVGARRDANETPSVALERDRAAARVRLNDPTGAFGKPNAGKFAAGANPMDERFSLDVQNASVIATTGYPMCIPAAAGGGADCPLTNRAPAPDASRFTCGAVRADATSPPHAACQPGQKAPVLEGDYITYAGMLTAEPGQPGQTFVAAHALAVDAGIYTSPGRDPAYVFIEEALVGMLGVPFPGFEQEETSRFRTVGFTTDPSRDVDVMVLDISASGATTMRLLTSLPAQRTGQIGRVRTTLPAKSNFLPVTREVRFRVAGPTTPGGPGLGEYTAPIGEYIYPEKTRFGQRPAFAVPVPFENFCVLLRGGGRLETLGRTSGPAIGRLDPFPRSGHDLAQPRADGSATCS